MRMDEIFNTKTELKWQQHSKFELTNFICMDAKYVIQIEKKQLPFDDLRNKKTAEISFFRDFEDSEMAHSTTNDVDFPFKVYGIVANSLITKFNEFDAFYFVANKRHSKTAEQFESKKKIYRFIADRLAKKIGALLFIHSDGVDEYFLVTRSRINKDGFIIEAEEALKRYKMTVLESEIPEIKRL